MRKLLVWCLLLICSGCALADLPLDVKWTESPAQMKALLEREGAKVKQKSFHKMGAPYLKSSYSCYGNTWDLTVYFDEKDVVNQLLFQLDDVSSSGANRAQKLAVSEIGKGYEIKNQGDKSRKDHLFVWSRKDADITLTTARYANKEERTLWLKLTPPK